MKITHGRQDPDVKAVPTTDAERRKSSRRYRRYRGKRTLGLSSSVHAKKAPASLYRNPADYPQDGLNHAQRRREGFRDMLVKAGWLDR